MKQRNDEYLHQESDRDEKQMMIDALAAALVQANRQNAPKMMTETAALPGKAASIDLVELFYHVVSKLVYVLITAVIFAVGMGYYAGKSVPTYTATSKLYIVGSQGATINMTDLQIGSMLKMDYEEVFKTWEVHELVRSKLNLNYSYSQMQGMLTVYIPEDTRVLYITIRHVNAQMASDIANAYAEAAKTFILQTMDTEEPNIFSVALVPSTAIVVSPTSYIIRGFILGTILALAVIVLQFVFDERPRTPEDIARIANIPTLTVMPSADKRSTRRSLLRRTRGSDYETH